MAILVELQDPRVRDVTVTKVEVAPDMRSAKIYVSVMGDEKKQTLSLRGLESSAGFLQTKVAKRIDTRYTPRLTFVLDQGVKKQLEIHRILQEVLPKRPDDEVADDGHHDGDTVMDDGNFIDAEEKVAGEEAAGESPSEDRKEQSGNDA